MKLPKWIKSLLKKPPTEQEIWRKNKIVREVAAAEMWTSELINWVNRENDPEKLSVASCLVNCSEWPEWLPGRPENYKDMTDSINLEFTVSVYEILKNKAEKLLPGLYQKIWLSHHFRNYQP